MTSFRGERNVPVPPKTRATMNAAVNAPTPAAPVAPTVASAPVVSPPGSSEGYSFAIWLARNKGSLKQAVSIGLGLVTAFLPQIKDTTVSIAAGALVKIVSQLALDWIDFRLSAVPLDQKP
jgi:hypothetical protein